MNDLASASEAYQASLEHHRAAREAAAICACPDSLVDELADDLARARAELEIAFFAHQLEQL